MRTVTASLLTIARRALRGEARLEPGTRLLVAVSGGPDSMALLHVLAKLAPEHRLSLRAHGVDHGLRADAAAELDLAEALAARLGVPWGRTRLALASGGNVHARARDARYDALARAAKEAGATAIATAHHADDRAETVLIRLLRGAGARGLAVLPPRAELAETGIALVRPLIRARHADVLEHLERHELASATDPSNADPRFLRARVRREVLPLLEELDPGVVEHLAAIADDLLAASPDDGGPRSSLPRATQTALEELVRGGSTKARVWLPGGLVVSMQPHEREGEAEPPREGTKRRPRAPNSPKSK